MKIIDVVVVKSKCKRSRHLVRNGQITTFASQSHAKRKMRAVSYSVDKLKIGLQYPTEVISII